MHGPSSERWEKSTSSKQDRLAIRRARQLCQEIERRTSEGISTSNSRNVDYPQRLYPGGFEDRLHSNCNYASSRSCPLRFPMNSDPASANMSYMDACLMRGRMGEDSVGPEDTTRRANVLHPDAAENRESIKVSIDFLLTMLLCP
jgi:hypothetical protein